MYLEQKLEDILIIFQEKFWHSLLIKRENIFEFDNFMHEFQNKEKEVILWATRRK